MSQPDSAIFHGRNCSPDLFWYGNIAKNLEDKGHIVWLPQMPNTEKADLKDWLPFVLGSKFEFSSETILIGHSAGATLILSILENIDIKIAKAFLVAGSIDLLNEGKPRPILQEKYHWEKIRNNVSKIYVINSDNDPYGANDKAGKKIADLSGGELIIAKGQGHFGSIRAKQTYQNFSLLEELL